ncbi:MAG: DNA polymerase III subunit beta [Candidatus Paceibacterota bacterium]|jgi:DNA polymerase-3 subunit beta
MTTKLILLKNNLTEALIALERAIGINTNLPILKNVLIRVEKAKIYFIATNLELAITCSVSGKIVDNGEITVPFSLFLSLAKNLTAERVTLEQKDKHLVITTDNYEATLQTQSAKEFPIIPTIHNTTQTLKISAPLFLETLRAVFVATQYSEIRPEISGFLLKFSEDRLFLVATDSFRLSESILESGEATSTLEECAVIVPFRTAEELLRFLASEKGNVDIFIDANQILFKTETKELISRLVDGVFPEYNPIIPKQTQNEILVNREEFVSAVKLASSFAGRANDITISVGENKKYIDLFCADSTLGENHYKIPVKLKGETFSIVFNWRYFLDGLKIFSNRDITLGVNSADRPAVLKDPLQPHLTYVVMPIKS